MKAAILGQAGTNKINNLALTGSGISSRIALFIGGQG
jgi:hypothetical protein